MLKIIISGCNGHMGRVIEALCNQDEDICVVAGFDVMGNSDHAFPVYSSPSQFTDQADAVIDFSSPAALDGLLAFAVQRQVPVIFATTGYSAEQVAAIGAAATKVPLFRSANMSLGINVLLDLVKNAAKVGGPKTEQKLIDEGYLPASGKTGDKASLQHFTTTARQEIIFKEMKKIVRGYLDLWYR